MSSQFLYTISAIRFSCPATMQLIMYCSESLNMEWLHFLVYQLWWVSDLKHASLHTKVSPWFDADFQTWAARESLLIKQERSVFFHLLSTFFHTSQMDPYSYATFKPISWDFRRAVETRPEFRAAMSPLCTQTRTIEGSSVLSFARETWPGLPQVVSLTSTSYIYIYMYTYRHSNWQVRPCPGPCQDSLHCTIFQ